MPKYDYKCSKCDTVVEVTRSFQDNGDELCSGCNSPMSRVWQATPAHFKGGGWAGKE